MVLALAVLAAFLVQAYSPGVDSFVRIDDHLDGAIPFYKLLADSQPIIGGLDDRVAAVFGGIPRNSLPSTLNLGTLLYYLMDPLAAHVVHESIMRLLAFIGMYLLLRRHLLPAAGEAVVCGASACFALLPFLPTGYLSVAGQPLLLHALLDLRKNRAGPWDWLILIVFPLYSSLIFVGFFLLLFLGILLLSDLIRTRRVSWPLVSAWLLMGGLYAVSEYRVLYQTLFDGGYVSHRSEFVRYSAGLLHVLRATYRTFFLDHRHVPSAQLPFLLPTVVAALGLGLIEARQRYGSFGPRFLARFLRERAGERTHLRWLVVVILLCCCTSLFVGVWEWEETQHLVQSSLFAPIRMFNFHRLQWFQPMLFGLAFALALQGITSRGRLGGNIALVLILAQGTWLIAHSHGFSERRDTGLTFHQYYSPELFHETQEWIRRPTESYRVASFGLTPAIALYNGFQVVDGFVNDYPLEYKHRFRRVIARELDKDAVLKTHFDNWGGHADLLSSELGRVSGYAKTLYTKHHATRKVENLEIDTGALSELGVEYLLSAVEIRNHASLGLHWEHTFERDDSPWEIFLYRLAPSEAATRAEGRLTFTFTGRTTSSSPRGLAATVSDRGQDLLRRSVLAWQSIRCAHRPMRLSRRSAQSDLGELPPGGLSGGRRGRVPHHHPVGSVHSHPAPSPCRGEEAGTSVEWPTGRSEGVRRVPTGKRDCRCSSTRSTSRSSCPSSSVSTGSLRTAA